MGKTRWSWFAGLLIATALFGLVACSEDASETGSLRMTLQDAPGDIEKLEVTISEVSVHFVPMGASDVEDGDVDGDAVAADGDMDDVADEMSFDKAGWHTIIDQPQTFDLIELKDNPVDLGILDLPVGKVTQIRLIVAEDPTPQATIDSEVVALTVPSGMVKLVSNFDIVADEETVIHLDFDAEESVIQQGDSYKLKPTIKIVED